MYSHNYPLRPKLVAWIMLSKTNTQGDQKQRLRKPVSSLIRRYTCVVILIDKLRSMSPDGWAIAKPACGDPLFSLLTLFSYVCTNICTKFGRCVSLKRIEIHVYTQDVKKYKNCEKILTYFSDTYSPPRNYLSGNIKLRVSYLP